MIITQVLEQNAKLYPDDVSLVEINPERWEDHKPVTWHDYELIEAAQGGGYRTEMTWKEFDEKANRFANLLLTRGIQKGDKVAILLMNCLEWLPIYFGTLKAGALAVPMNYRYTADEIKYCLELSDASTLVFGPEFIGRVEAVFPKLKGVNTLFYVGENVPSFADSYDRLVTYCSKKKPDVCVTEEDHAAIYFSSGTTGFPKAILHSHAGLASACETEQNHHSQTREDVFLCIPPLYHTGAKMHW
ncbi:MAG: acyl--CoA ligase, partial [Clostridia bacterium]|nr:acyl--CoA ligase [Clostridia bacterium]